MGRLSKRARIFALAALVVGAVGLVAPGAAADDGRQLAQRRPLNEIPMFGNVELTPAQKRANDRYLDDVRNSGYTLEAAADHAIKRGWEAIGNKDVRTAIRRFNQAWLLDPKNGRAYWGFAVVLYMRDRDTAGAIGMFERALALRPDDALLHVDYANVLARGGRVKDAITHFNLALGIEPRTPRAHLGLYKIYLGLDDAGNALTHLRMLKALGLPVSDDEIERLRKEAEK